MGLLVHEAQVFGVELLETVFLLSPAHHKHVSKCLVCVQKELGLSYIPELSTVILSLLVTLIQTELEHEQLSILKLLLFLLKWKSENGMVI
ncbi:Protein RST1 [Camellia lanceoleosa]|nr:Protein RST1 [Camellia lanceoleosa]